MYDNQLDFRSDGLVFDNLRDRYDDDIVINSYVPNEAYQIRQMPQEQLDYMIQNDINIFPLQKPKPLVYKTGAKKLKTAKPFKPFKNNTYGRVFGKSSGYGGVKVGKPKSDKTPKSTSSSQQIAPQFNLNTANHKGLFDPGLKKNELDMVRRSQKQREERMDKIKNYDIKFGIKVKNLKVYNNYVDMLDDMMNAKADKEYYKPEKLKRRQPEPDWTNIQPSTAPNNLDFDFTAHEQVIQSLEKQIEYERAKRTEVNMKYFQKMKELEEVKAKKLTGTSKPLTKKARGFMRTYSTPKIYKGNTRFKKDLNKSADMVRSCIPKDRRPKSSVIVERSMEKIKPSIKKMIDQSYNNIYKEIIRNNQDIITKTGKSERKSQKSARKGNISTEVPRYDNNQGHNMSRDNVMSSQDYNSIPNSNLFTNPMSNPMYNTHGFIQLNNPSSVDNRIVQGLINERNVGKFNTTDKLMLLNNLNKEVESYNKGIPKLIEKVEKTIDRINTTGALNEKLHPLIDMASKHSGKLLHLHLDEVIELLIDDLLEETVFELDKIEQIEKGQKNKQQFTSFISNYYQTFELMRNVEHDVSRKLTTKDYDIRPKPKAARDGDIVLYRNPFEYPDNDSELKKKRTINPNLLLSPEAFAQRGVYSTKIHDGLLVKCEKYKKSYLEHMKTTGAFYFPNIFTLYDNIVDEVLKDLLDEQLDHTVRQIDKYAQDIYKEELFR
jgi:hypothetical protein